MIGEKEGTREDGNKWGNKKKKKGMNSAGRMGDGRVTGEDSSGEGLARA